MAIVYVPPKNNKAKTIKIDDIDNNFQSKDVEGALKELSEKGGSNIDDVNISDKNTFSNKKIEEKFSDVNAQFNTKANQADVELVEERLNNIIANNTPTEGNAELIDIRVGADGTTYANAGESVRVQFNNHKTQLQQITEKNDTQDTRLKDIEHKNKVQDIYLSGLFNENADGRLTIEGEGNDLKLEGSKDGLVEIENVIGNTLVNLATVYSGEFNFTSTAITGGVSNGVTIPLLKTINGVFTVILNIKEHTLDKNCKIALRCDNNVTIYPSGIHVGTKGIYIATFNTLQNETYLNMNSFRLYTDNTTEGAFSFYDLIILEGDYTDKPIPNECFEGLQSSFEDCQVTQDMIDEGLEEAENLGKYKVPVRVVGKNLFDINNLEPIDKQDSSYEVVNGNTLRIISTITTISTSTYLYHRFKVNLHGEKRLVLSAKGIPQTVDMNSSVKFGIRFYNSNKETVGIAQSTSSSYLVVDVPNGASYCGIFFYVCVGQSGIAKGSYIDYTNIQLEEVEAGVSSPSTYEPYFERTTNVYLNSPLLEGDEIVMNNGELCHYHNRKLRDDLHSLNWTYLNQYDTDDSVVFNTSDVKDYPLDTQAASFDILSDKFKSASYVVSANTHYSICLMDNLKGLRVRVPKSALTEVTPTGLQTLLKNMNSKIIYQLAQPYYEPIQADKLLLECANDSTLHIDTLIPTESIKVSYTGNIPSVYVLEATGEQNTYDIADTQIAVDYLLMSSRELGVMAMSLNTEDNLTKKGMNTMGAYFASRIMKGYLDYSTVVKKYPEFKEDIDFILRSEGREDLIVS